MPKFIRPFTLTLLLLVTPSYGVDQSINGSSEEFIEETAPNPIDLQPEWNTYFEVNEPVLIERTAEVKTVLDSLHNQLEILEEKQEAEKRIKEFHSHLQSLILLKQHVIQKPDLAWLPKTSYTLNDYLEISDRIRDFNLDINYKNTDLERFNYYASDLRQTLNNNYSKYLTLPENTNEKFLQGLGVMALGARLLYLEAEAQLAKDLIEVDKQHLERFQKERNFINKDVELEVNIEEVDAEKGKIKIDLSELHNELISLEAQSIKAFSEKSSQEASRLINQKLTNTLIREALIRSKLFLLEAKSTLYTALHAPYEIEYGKNIEPIKSFRTNTRNQLFSWEEVTTSEIDQLSQALVKTNGEKTEEERVSAYEESLKLSLSNKAFLESLSKELYHIWIVLGLIDQNVIEKQNLPGQMSYTFQSSWQWFTEFFEMWFYYSLVEIAGIPITLMGLFKAALIILASFWLSKLLGRGLKKFGMGKGKIVESTLYTFRRIFHYLILLVGVLFALASLGLTMRNMAIVLGALGIGVGFGLQNIVNNFLCGLAILFERNVKIGDYIELESGRLGKVTEVNVQKTTLHTFDGLDILVPNSSIVGDNIINWTKRDPFQRLHIPFCVAYGTDQKKVSKVVCEAAMKVRSTVTGISGVADPEVWLVEFGDSSLNFELVVWVNIFSSRGREAMKAAYLSEIELAFKENAIHIPFPQRDLYLKTFPAEEIKFVKK